MLFRTKKVTLKSISGEDARKLSFIVRRSSDSINFLPLEKGKGETNFLCGHCGFTLLKKVDEQSVIDHAYLCPTCQTFNSL